METNIKTLTFVGMAILALCFGACKKSAPPTVKIYDNAISVSYTSANVTGEVTDDGGSPVIDRGFIYGKQGESRQDTMYCGNGAGEFPTRLTNLEPNTTYNCMAFARNDAGMAYSGKATFTTLPMAQSEVTTYEPTNVTHTHATCGGNVVSDGGSEVTERGVCWATTPNPTTSGSHLASGLGTGDFTVNLSGLTANTTYHVRAYAVNEKGTAYGDDVTFRTVAYGVPTVITVEVSNITSTSATCGGNVTSNGGLTVTARGICWSRTNQNPTISDSHTTDGTGTGEFISNITGLTQNATYYVRAYATNSQGTGYGDSKSFKAASIENWFYYDNNSYNDSWGWVNGGSFQWAVMFPVSILSQYAGTSITKVKAYFNYTGTYTLKIYSGGTSSPTTLQKTQTVSVTSTGWKEITISPLALNANQPLWISMIGNNYAAAASNGIGNRNARWVYSSENGWMDMTDTNGDEDLTWMLRVFVTSAAKGNRGLEEVIPTTIINENKSGQIKKVSKSRMRK